MDASDNSSKTNASLNLNSILERFRANPRFIFIILAAAFISVIIALLFWAKSPDYRVLYSNISDEDGGAIVAQLTQMNVPYSFQEHGGAIMVPADRVYEARLKLAQQGLPKGGQVGFELLDQEKFGLSQFNEQINYQRALEGELARTIEKLGPVRSARVHLAIPKQTLFVREQKSPSASVTLDLNTGRLLDAGQVNAISWLISSAVPGLNADNVTLVDQSGNLLTQRGAQAIQTNQLKYINEIEADYRQRIQAILAPVVGAANVKTQVTAQVDFTTHEQTAEQYQPNSAPENMAVRSRQTNSSEQGSKAGPGGVPGALSNQPPVPTSAPIEQPAAANNPQADENGALIPTLPYSRQKDETTNYELNRTLIHTKRSPGNIERLSVAVVVNYQPDGEGKPVALSKEQMEQIQALVKEAMGYSSERGDTLNVVNSLFNTDPSEPEIPFWQQAFFIDLMLTAGRYLLVALVALVLWRKMLQPFWMKHQELALQRLEMEKEARQAELNAQQRKAEMREQAKAQLRVETEVNVQQLRSLAEQDPQVIALVLRQWMNKEQSS
ncbi:flagellar M-ring protein FliF [Mixta theicola]|uniref:Flagellar M-ring protein n=1 Tax=Mixta theicola TaxID=1458355 RepID=A0A2K1Q844_9GAMM|nr:flagellar basal-body MS-ring/collar protein FliF [Mixta theicola]PNS11188.1 flagellar M-ring protein FliF [Mixta theicola]GLR07549.1 flagellar M-ring protein [Mixta theicola]